MRIGFRALVTSAIIVVVGAVFAGAALAGTGTATITARGTTSLSGGSTSGADGIQNPEFPSGGVGAEAPVDRSLSFGDAPAGPTVSSGRKAKSNPELGTSFTGITHRDQRLASGGNQWSLEPPDQGLCAGNGYVVETVNDAIAVYRADGSRVSLKGLNEFYGYKPAINRTTGEQGPFITDPSCLWDADSQRWYHVVLTLDVDPATGAFLGTNHLDIAVSKTADPTGAWSLFSPIEVSGDCVSAGHSPCLGDYPHIGIDKYGIYVTTNSYPFFVDGFDSAWLYAISKRQLGGLTAKVWKTDTATADGGKGGFTVLPASGGQEFDTSQGGTQWFTSSDAAEEVNNGSYITANQILVWALTNTSSLDTVAPSPKLSQVAVSAGAYGLPPQAGQKAGTLSLGGCLNTLTCAKQILGTPDRFNEIEGGLDASDTRMLATTYAQGKLWAALDTGVNVDGSLRAGIEWFIVDAKTSSAGVSASVTKQGYLAVANNDVIYPAIGVTSSGRGVMGFTLTGSDNFPSQGYASIDALAGVGDVHTAAAGLGPQDGFSEYKAFGNPPRPRWGDYAAAAVDGASVWIANEWISAPACTVAQYQSTGFSCSGTRTALGNWSTRISNLTP